MSKYIQNCTGMKQIRNEVDSDFAQPKAFRLKLRNAINKLKSAFIRLIRVVRVPIRFKTVQK